MTRSIFDPAGGDTERSGSAFSPPEAQQDSHLPSEMVDGAAEETEIDDATDTDDTSLSNDYPAEPERDE